ncbi:hypothetical protein [Microcoleus sp. B7-D4]|uniref:hypothetical protein n=1 Tax=Microcoleus sp. B7-D4 TaxID=2818696 RepID=UPI002FD18EC1
MLASFLESYVGAYLLRFLISCPILQVSRLYPIPRRIRVGAVRHWWRMPDAIARPLSCLQAKQPADVDDGEGIVRPIASKSAIALHLGCPIHKGASFLFKSNK